MNSILLGHSGPLTHDNHQNPKFWVNEVHQVVVVSVFLDIAVVIIRPARRPHIHYLEPVTAVVESPVTPLCHTKAVFLAKIGAEFLLRNLLASAVSVLR